MAIDLNRFIGTFFDEAQEHLESIEEMAMSLGAGQRDPEILNAIFRAAHSIKGGSGTFGFSQLTNATHEMETLFDALRKGQGEADDAMVRVLLDACDAFKDHLARLKEGDQGADPAMDAMRKRLAGFRTEAAAPAGPREPQNPALRTILACPAGGPADSATRRALEVALAAFGDIVAGPDATGALRVATGHSLDELREALEFALPPGSFALEEDGGAKDDRYGLFADDDPGADPEDRYGLFVDLDEPPTAVPAAQSEPPQPPASSPLPTSAVQAEGSAADGAGGATEALRARAEQSSIRVSVEKIDRIVNLVGELVVAQAMLQQAAGATDTQHDENLTHSLTTLDRNTRELQQAVMSIRMMPVEFVFSRFPRLVYDVSTQLGKRVQLRTQGHETELDKEMIEQLIDPLTHVLRNAIDHGIESPEERRLAGKPETGTIVMRATHRGGSVIIEVSDDGRGLDRERILAKARDLGMAVGDAMSDDDVWAVIFEAGFSTAKEVTQLSGRGVGMDVARRNINALGGNVSVTSVRGGGTTIAIQLPLTLAVLDGMIVSVGDEQYIVPLEFVAEAFKPDSASVTMVVNQASLVSVRGEHLPIVRLEDVVDLPESDAARPEPLCLVVEIDGRRAALLVDSLVGQQQLVVKSLDTNLHSVRGAAGATILGDGRVALILDVGAIIRTGVSRPGRSSS